MVSLELDPVFVKALRLLHSTHKDSAGQLYSMLNDAIAQRKGLKTSTSQDAEKLTSTKLGIKSEDESSKKHETEKRSLDKLKQELSEVPQDAKKPRRESPVSHEKETKHSKERDKDKEREREKAKKEKEVKEREKSKSERRDREKASSDKSDKEKTKDVERSKDHAKGKETTTEDSSEDEASMDADDFAFGLGISCVVCRQFDVSSGNQLVECQECHNLYHQECHRPPATEQDVTDPRFVWYCTRCSKTMKKMATKTQKPKTTPPAVSSTKETVPFMKPVAVKTEQPSTLQPFKRLDHKTSTSKEAAVTSSSKPLSGLASLAANLSGKTADPSRAGFSKPEAIKLGDSSKSSGFKQESGKVADSSKSAKDLSKSSLSKPEPLKAFSALKSDLSKLAVSKNEDRSAFGSALARGGLKPIGSGSKFSSSSSSAFTSSKSSSSMSASSGGSKFSAVSSSSASKTSGSSSAAKLSFGSVLTAATSKTSTGGTATVVHAEKRLQMMKKKAAAKSQEKRLNLK